MKNNKTVRFSRIQQKAGIFTVIYLVGFTLVKGILKAIMYDTLESNCVDSIMMVIFFLIVYKAFKQIITAKALKKNKDLRINLVQDDESTKTAKILLSISISVAYTICLIFFWQLLERIFLGEVQPKLIDNYTVITMFPMIYISVRGKANQFEFVDEEENEVKSKNEQNNVVYKNF